MKDPFESMKPDNGDIWPDGDGIRKETDNGFIDAGTQA
ncbi:MAG: hypothetical protein JWL82_372 [Parcubacteria group bacterium]|nr:hypothetical protein [Parcubacteria group bacterium]